MNEARLRSLFRKVLFLSMGAPAAMAAASCGGAVASITGEDDGGGDSPCDCNGGGDPDGGSDGRDAMGRPDRLTEPDRFLPDGGACGNDAAALPDATQCLRYVPKPCDVDAAGPLSTDECTALCGVTTVYCYENTLDGHTVIQCNTCLGAGRRPAGYDGPDAFPCTSPLGAYFSAMAQLEAASIDAFRILRDELVFHGAPRPLVRDAERAQADEVRHARVTKALAETHGASPRTARRTTKSPRAIRPLEEIALENAIEGCVRETYGAVTASWQAEAAEDPTVRALMRRIARDETRHAALAWRVARWMRPRLSLEARARVDQAMRGAVAHLAIEVDEAIPAALTRVAGVPQAAQAKKIVGAMRDVIWAA